MNTDFVTLSSLTALANERYVDYEVWHGETTHADKRLRTHMLISPANAPEALVSFGDAKHGQQLSRIVLAKNDRINIKKEDLFRAMFGSSVTNTWKRAIQKNTPLFNMEFKQGKVVIPGTIATGKAELLMNSNDESYYDYELHVRNFLMNTVTERTQEVDSTRFILEVPHKDPQPYVSSIGQRFSEAEAKLVRTPTTHAPRDMGNIEVNTKVTITGDYQYPNRVLVTGLSF